MTPLFLPGEKCDGCSETMVNPGGCCESWDELQMNYQYPTFYCSIVLPGVTIVQADYKFSPAGLLRFIDFPYFISDQKK